MIGEELIPIVPGLKANRHGHGNAEADDGYAKCGPTNGLLSLAGQQGKHQGS